MSTIAEIRQLQADTLAAIQSIPTQATPIVTQDDLDAIAAAEQANLDAARAKVAQ